MKNVKILIVDDDEDLLDGQKLYLTNKGYEVKTALSMEEGLKIIENYKPDIIIVDLMMEHYDTGFVFCKKIKEKIEKIRNGGSNRQIQQALRPSRGLL